MRLRIGKAAAIAAMALSLAFAGGPARAQSMFGFKIGQDLRTGAATHPEPTDVGKERTYVVARWKLKAGNSVSVTAAPGTGKILFIESDWGGDPANAATDVPGLTFGSTTLGDIRTRFGSNGFGFTSNVVSVIDKNLVSFNCYRVAGDDDQVLVVVTTLARSSIPTVHGQPAPKLGEGHLDAVILASLAYLKGLWGTQTISDRGEHPITLN